MNICKGVELVFKEEAPIVGDIVSIEKSKLLEERIIGDIFRVSNGEYELTLIAESIDFSKNNFICKVIKVRREQDEFLRYLQSLLDE